MTKNNRFSPTFEKGHFNGLVDEGKYLRKSSLYKQILPRTPTRPKTSVNPVILSMSSSCPSCASWLKNLFNQRNPRLINDLRSTKVYVRKNNLFMQNKANFKKVKFDVTKVLIKDYDQMDTWSIRKTKPIQSQLKPIKANSKPIKPNKMPKQTQFKPKQTQFRMILAYFSSSPLILAYFLSRQKNAPFHLFTVGYLRKKLYSITTYIGNIRLISRLMAKEKLK